MSLRARIALLQAAVLAVTFTLLGALLVETLERILVGEVDDTLTARAWTVASEVKGAVAAEPGQVDAAQLEVDPEPLQEFSSPVIYVQLLRPDGQLLASSRNLPSGGLPAGRGAGADGGGGGTSLDTVPVAGDERVRVLTLPIQTDNRVAAIVRVGQSLHQIDSLLRGLVRLLVVAGLASLIAAVFATLLLVGQALDPLRRIAGTAERIANTGDVNLQVPGSSTREVGQLASSFNRMIERLRRLLESQQQLLADTSHELRNPLTVIRTNIGLLSRELDPVTRQEVATEAEAEAERMSSLVADLLLLAHQERAANSELIPTRLDLLVADVVDQFRQLAPEHIIALRSEELTVRADPERLRQIVANLLENATRHTPPGGRIEVELRRIGSDVELSVTDSGEGIEPRHLPRIFDRFYRVDPARSRATGGTGLGLAIVKHVAEAHGGRVAAESQVGHGSRFLVTLPAEPSWAINSPEATPAEPSARGADFPPAEARATPDRPVPRR